MQDTELLNVAFSEIRESSGKHQREVQPSLASLDDNFSKKSVANFDYHLSQNVSAIVGKTAFLTCVVKNLQPSQKVTAHIKYNIDRHLR